MCFKKLKKTFSAPYKMAFMRTAATLMRSRKTSQNRGLYIIQLQLLLTSWLVAVSHESEHVPEREAFVLDI